MWGLLTQTLELRVRQEQSLSKGPVERSARCHIFEEKHDGVRSANLEHSLDRNGTGGIGESSFRRAHSDEAGVQLFELQRSSLSDDSLHLARICIWLKNDRKPLIQPGRHIRST